MSGEIKPFGGFCVPDSQNCPRKAEEDKLKAEVCQLKIIIATTKKLLLERAGKNDNTSLRQPRMDGAVIVDDETTDCGGCP